MDTATRLTELIERWERRSREVNRNGWAEIHYSPAHPSTRAFPNGWAQSWYIVYRNRDGSQSHVGMTIGHTRAGAILWLLAYFKQWD